MRRRTSVYGSYRAILLLLQVPFISAAWHDDGVSDVVCVEEEPCGDRGTCIPFAIYEVIPHFMCDCFPGYHGDECQNVIDSCEHGPCINGGTCEEPAEGGFLCQCPYGFMGITCEVEVTCEHEPCHGSPCVSTESGYSCTCLPGYLGIHCEVEMTSCDQGPCANGATCLTTNNGFGCTCRHGYTGTYCEVVVTCAEHEPCFNGAGCEMQSTGYRCNCLTGYYGDNCEGEGVDYCADQPCFNGGTCLNEAHEYSCRCAPGWAGPQCQGDAVLGEIEEKSGPGGKTIGIIIFIAVLVSCVLGFCLCVQKERAKLRKRHKSAKARGDTSEVPELGLMAVAGLVFAKYTGCGGGDKLGKGLDLDDEDEDEEEDEDSDNSVAGGIDIPEVKLIQKEEIDGRKSRQIKRSSVHAPKQAPLKTPKVRTVVIQQSEHESVDDFTHERTPPRSRKRRSGRSREKGASQRSTGRDGSRSGAMSTGRDGSRSGARSTGRDGSRSGRRARKDDVEIPDADDDYYRRNQSRDKRRHHSRERSRERAQDHRDSRRHRSPKSRERGRSRPYADRFPV